MAYTYQQFNGWNIVPMPQSLGPRQVTFRQNDSVGMTSSPFTMQSQVQAWPGADWWEADVSLPPMSQAKARAWIAFLAALRGKQNVFAMGDPSWRVPGPGIFLGQPALSASHLATATFISTNGWPGAGYTTSNLLPDPDAVTPSSWILANSNPTGVYGFVNLVGAGRVSGNAWGLYGNGSVTPPSVYVQSPNAAVTAGATYTASVFIDARGLTSGQLGFQAIAASGTTLIGQGAQVAGQAGWISTPIIVPNGQSAVYFRFFTATNCVISPNQPVTWSNPQLILGVTPPIYTSPAVLLPGDYIQIGSRLHMVAGPIGVYPDSGGNAQIEIWPSLRENQASGLALGVYNPTGLFRLADNKREWSVDEARHAGISFKAVEAR